MLKSLPVREPERLIELLTDRGKGQPYNSFSGPALAYFRDHATTLDGVIASHTTRFFVVVDNAAPELAGGQYVTGNFFEVLGVRTLIGRTVYSSDDRPNAEPVAVLSHAYWQRRFGADPLAVGRRMTIDDHVFTVVGVAPPAFHGTLVGREIDVWIPLSAEPVLRKRSWMGRASTKWLQILGRLKTGTSYEQARAELQMLFQAAVVDPEVALLKEVRPDHPAGRGIWRSNPRMPAMSAVRRQVRCAAPRAAGDQRPGARHRLRERGKSAAHARERAASRNRRPLVAWRRTCPRRASAVDREHAAGDGRGGGRHCPGVRRLPLSARVFHDEPYADRAGGRARSAHARVYRRARRRDRPAVWPRAGVAGDGADSRNIAHGQWPCARKPRSSTPEPNADRRPGRAVGDDAVLRRSLSALPAQPSFDRYGL